MKRMQFKCGVTRIAGILTAEVIALVTFALVTEACRSACADQGMWLFNDVPEERLARDVGFVPSREWLDHLQSAAVRFNSGGSGAFVSPPVSYTHLTLPTKRIV